MAARCRTAQILILGPVYVSIAFTGVGGAWLEAAWPASIIALYVDDLLTGDDERWHRFWKRVRSLVRGPVALRPQADA